MLLLSSAIALLAATARADTHVRLVLSDNSPAYQQFLVAFRDKLASSKASVDIVESKAGDTPQSGGKPADLIIAVGIKAAEGAITNIEAPVLSVMLPKMAYEALLERRSPAQRTKSLSAIYLDQPWNRQMSFIQAVLPKHNIVGLLYSPYNSIILPRLPRGISINAQSVRSAETLFATLENVLNNSDVLLVTHDSEIYTSNNVRNILLTSYRLKVPLIGISQSYVNTGALCAIFSTPEQIGEQAAEILASFARDRRLPEPQYPRFFSIGLNEPVARSLEIELPSPEAIRERMNKAGELR